VFDVMGLKEAQNRDVTQLVTDEKALADAARAELLKWCHDNRFDPRKAAERFYDSQDEELGSTLDPSAVRNLLQALKDEHQKAAS
jgi:hypothetical protein